MRKEPYKFLQAIQETPSPSGFEQPVQRIVRKRMAPYANSVETDVHGNVIVALNPEGSPRDRRSGQAGTGGARSRAIRARICPNIRPDTATSAIWNET